MTTTDAVARSLRADLWYATLPLLTHLTGVDEAEIAQRPYTLFRELYADRLNDEAFGGAIEKLRHMVTYTAADSMPDVQFGTQRRAFFTRYSREIFEPLQAIVLSAPPGQINEASHHFRNAYAMVNDHFQWSEDAAALRKMYPTACNLAWGTGGQQGQVVRCMVMSLYILQHGLAPARPLPLSVEERAIYRRVSELFVAMLAWAAEGYATFGSTVIES